MINAKELKKKAKEILEPLECMEVDDGMIVMLYALSWLIKSYVKKEEHGECLDNLAELLKTLLVEGGEE